MTLHLLAKNQSTNFKWTLGERKKMFHKPWKTELFKRIFPDEKSPDKVVFLHQKNQQLIGFQFVIRRWPNFWVKWRCKLPFFKAHICQFFRKVCVVRSLSFFFFVWRDLFWFKFAAIFDVVGGTRLQFSVSNRVDELGLLAKSEPLVNFLSFGDRILKNEAL